MKYTAGQNGGYIPIFASKGEDNDLRLHYMIHT